MLYVGVCVLVVGDVAATDLVVSLHVGWLILYVVMCSLRDFVLE